MRSNHVMHCFTLIFTGNSPTTACDHAAVLMDTVGDRSRSRSELPDGLLVGDDERSGRMQLRDEDSRGSWAEPAPYAASLRLAESFPATAMDRVQGFLEKNRNRTSRGTSRLRQETTPEARAPLRSAFRGSPGRRRGLRLMAAATQGLQSFPDSPTSTTSALPSLPPPPRSTTSAFTGGSRRSQAVLAAACALHAPRNPSTSHLSIPEGREDEAAMEDEAEDEECEEEEKREEQEEGEEVELTCARVRPVSAWPRRGGRLRHLATVMVPGSDAEVGAEGWHGAVFSVNPDDPLYPTLVLPASAPEPAPLPPQPRSCSAPPTDTSIPSNFDALGDPADPVSEEWESNRPLSAATVALLARSRVCQTPKSRRGASVLAMAVSRSPHDAGPAARIAAAHPPRAEDPPAPVNLVDRRRGGREARAVAAADPSWYNLPPAVVTTLESAAQFVEEDRSEVLSRTNTEPIARPRRRRTTQLVAAASSAIGTQALSLSQPDAPLRRSNRLSEAEAVGDTPLRRSLSAPGSSPGEKAPISRKRSRSRMTASRKESVSMSPPPKRRPHTGPLMTPP